MKYEGQVRVIQVSTCPHLWPLLCFIDMDICLTIFSLVWVSLDRHHKGGPDS